MSVSQKGCQAAALRYGLVAPQAASIQSTFDKRIDIYIRWKNGESKSGIARSMGYGVTYIVQCIERAEKDLAEVGVTWQECQDYDDAPDPGQE